jgi:hypothetical protein
MSYAIIPYTNPSTNLVRLYLQLHGRNIWVNQKIAQALNKVHCPSLDELRVIRYQTPHKTLFYLEYEQESSLISSDDAAFILQQQGLLNPELMRKTPTVIAKALMQSTPKQIPYFIDEVWYTGKEPCHPLAERHSWRDTKWFIVNYRGHYLARYKTRTEAVRLVRILYELGQPTIAKGILMFETCNFRIHILNRDGDAQEQSSTMENICTSLIVRPTFAVIHAPTSIKKG